MVWQFIPEALGESKKTAVSAASPVVRASFLKVAFSAKR